MALPGLVLIKGRCVVGSRSMPRHKIALNVCVGGRYAGSSEHEGHELRLALKLPSLGRTIGLLKRKRSGGPEEPEVVDAPLPRTAAAVAALRARSPSVRQAADRRQARQGFLWMGLPRACSGTRRWRSCASSAPRRLSCEDACVLALDIVCDGIGKDAARKRGGSQRLKQSH